MSKSIDSTTINDIQPPAYQRKGWKPYVAAPMAVMIAHSPIFMVMAYQREARNEWRTFKRVFSPQNVQGFCIPLARMAACEGMFFIMFHAALPKVRESMQAMEMNEMSAPFATFVGTEMVMSRIRRRIDFFPPHCQHASPGWQISRVILAVTGAAWMRCKLLNHPE